MSVRDQSRSLLRSRLRITAVVIFLSGCGLLSGCGRAEEPDPSQPEPTLSFEEQLDPKRCQPCHPRHYDEWSRSVHAAASTDPIFRALNALGQQETEGELGSFCVQCHAPAALALGATSDGLNLDQVSRELQGVTCVYCHQVSEVNGDHNNQLTWARDGVMRGGISDPEPSPAHRSMLSPLLDGDSRASSDLCGACHDIVLNNGVHLERTYLEWSESVFALPEQRGSGCVSCHMPSRSAQVSTLGETTPTRRHHDHLMPGVDPVLIPYDRESSDDEMSGDSLLDAIQRELDLSLLSELCVEVGASGGADLELYLENVSAGHRFPSGAALDRRVWVEARALDARGEVMWSSGVVPPAVPAVEVERADPSMWLLRDRAYNDRGAETHYFWEVSDVERGTLPTPTLLSLADRLPSYEEPHVLKRYRFATERAIAEIQMSVKMRPIALELIYDLIERGLLSAEMIGMLPTFELRAAAKRWRLEDSTPRVTLSGRELLCVP